MSRMRKNTRHCTFLAFTVVSLLLIIPGGLAFDFQYQCGKRGDGALCPPDEGYCCSKSGWCGNKDIFCGEGYCESQCPPPKDITGVISSDIFETMLPGRDTNRACRDVKGFYTYDAFVEAARNFTGFGTIGSINDRKREVAGFFAHTAAATARGYSINDAIGYCYKRQWGLSPSTLNSNCDRNNVEWRCAPGKKYYGRGPFQLTGNGVYGPCGAAIGEDLLNNPDLVENDPLITFKSAIWRWMTPKTVSSCHDIMVGNWVPTESDIDANRFPGFGLVTNVLYGQEMCGKGVLSYETLRWEFYLRFCQILDVTPGAKYSCADQQPFSVNLFYANE